MLTPCIPVPFIGEIFLSTDTTKASSIPDMLSFPLMAVVALQQANKDNMSAIHRIV
jgi:hypothetical protein